MDPAAKTDFESQWQAKLGQEVASRLGEQAREQVLAGGDALDDRSSSRQKLVWTCGALERLGDMAETRTRERILAGCHCVYPVEDLQDVKAAYQVSGDIDQVLALLQERFEGFLREGLELEEELIQQVLSRGWGLAGRREGQQVIATKIPKSGFLRAYFQEIDPLEKRRLYCHCPRVRDQVGSEPGLPREYCYCGAGYYQGIWEEILGRPVQVEVLQSVMAGDEVCQIAVHI